MPGIKLLGLAPSPTRRIIRLAGFGQHRTQFLDKVLDIREFSINAGKADIGHLIQLSEMFHHPLAQVAAIYFTIEVHIHIVLNGRQYRLNLLVADRPLPARFCQAGPDFFSLEGFTYAILLDNL